VLSLFDTQQNAKNFNRVSENEKKMRFCFVLNLIVQCQKDPNVNFQEIALKIRLSHRKFTKKLIKKKKLVVLET
jgi:hypothetical protein